MWKCHARTGVRWTWGNEFRIKKMMEKHWRGILPCAVLTTITLGNLVPHNTKFRGWKTRGRNFQNKIDEPIGHGMGSHKILALSFSTPPFDTSRVIFHPIQHTSVEKKKHSFDEVFCRTWFPKNTKTTYNDLGMIQRNRDVDKPYSGVTRRFTIMNNKRFDSSCCNQFGFS